jgi:two-component system response regulator HydG
MNRLPPSSYLMDALPEPAVLIDMNYRILAANNAYRERYGSFDTAAPVHCFQVSHHYDKPCDLAGETCPLKNSLLSGQPQRVLHLHYTPRGEEHVDVETLPIRNDAGEITYFLEVLRQSDVASTRADGDGLIGRSRAFNHMLELIQRVATSGSSVLLLGESGTGKELAAKAVHDASQRANGPFVPLDCSGLTETLFESELFGHEKGAFTGAHNRKIGLVEAARGGTLFLDEMGDIPLGLQVKLLRLLETGTFRRVGAIEPLTADFRLICATHRDLEQMVDNGTFRRDLYYRISVFPIHLPPLRERSEDITLLAESMLNRTGGGGRNKRLHPAALACLRGYAFPGNIRELRNILERAALLADGEWIHPEHLPAECRGTAETALVHGADKARVRPLEEIEKDYLRWALQTHHGDRGSLARQLGLSERTLYRKLQLLGPIKRA